MRKFKRGDKVKILDGGNMGGNWHISWLSSVYNKFFGIETYITQEPTKSGKHWYYKLNIDKSNSWFVDDWLELLED